MSARNQEIDAMACVRLQLQCTPQVTNFSMVSDVAVFDSFTLLEPAVFNHLKFSFLFLLLYQLLTTLPYPLPS